MQKKSPERIVIASGKWHLVKRQQQLHQQQHQQRRQQNKPNFGNTAKKKKKEKPLFSTSNVERFSLSSKA